jgi:hypothetical protein
MDTDQFEKPSRVQLKSRGGVFGGFDVALNPRKKPVNPVDVDLPAKPEKLGQNFPISK